MDAREPGLFDLPERERPATSERPLRGRNRETWARTATAEVTIVDAGALHEAAARVQENAVTIGLRADPDVEGAARALVVVSSAWCGARHPNEAG